MADETVYGNSPITILHNNSSHSQVLDSLIIPNELDQSFDGFWLQSAKKRRLSVDQVQFLEKNFELENKLDPDRKIQLAKDLGLHPRQVAIWFQNRRARCKTKQLEKDYASLKSTYDNLKSDYQNLLSETDNLKTELQNLKRKLAIPETGEFPIGKQTEEASSGNQNSSMADSDCFSQDEEDNFSRNLLPICFPKLENSYYDDDPTEDCCNLIGFQIEDQALGFWPY